MSEDCGRDDYEATHIPVAYGWGGMVVRDGVGSPMPDEMALESVLPAWAEMVPDTELVVDLCFRALRYDSTNVRVVALETLAKVAARPEPLPQLEEVRREIQRALYGDDPRVQSAARARSPPSHAVKGSRKSRRLSRGNLMGILEVAALFGSLCAEGHERRRPACLPSRSPKCPRQSSSPPKRSRSATDTGTGW
jgi:hypothetical protein